ncbi:MAG TPA: chemotaxis protein CheW [Phycisphaerae bacterium]|nr:chemotaxis protein CheW [Phycisphaerae bacterium]HRR85917.1 chemotaxis protein CheW [Phycisphaerae bacterium]
MSLDNQKMIEEFVVESFEHLADVENDLLTIEEGGADSDPELVNKVFRAVHSIKGAAGFLGLTTINDLAHSLENVLNLVRSKELVPTAPVVDSLLRSVDALRGLLNNVNTSNEQDVRSFIDALKQIISGQASPEVSASLERNVQVGQPATAMFEVSEHLLATHRRLGHQLFVLDFDLIKDVEERGKTPLSLIKDLLALGEVVEARLDAFNLGDLSTGIPDRLRFVALIGTVVDRQMLMVEFGLAEEHIHQVADAGSASPAPAAQAAPAVAAQAVAIPAAPAAPPSSAAPAAPPVSAQDSSPPSETSKTNVETSIRVSVGLLDHLMNLAGELVLSRNQLVQTINNRETRNLESVSARLDQVTSELQEAIMQTRMQPIGTVFNKFPRIVRDLSGKLGKQCDLTIEGKDVDLDKSILETIGDPLTHLIRNSVDHGIEAPQERTSKGKNPIGRISLRAFHQAGKVNIEISDDGAGIDVNKIKTKAVSKGLISTERAREMTDREALSLIFLPGFSLAEKVTDVSGRGVGMDVVRTNIERLGGTVEIESRVNSGTTIRISLPLTLAIIPSLIVRCGEERFAIPQVNINELVRIKAGDVKSRIEHIKNAEVLRLRGNLLPLVRLSRALGLQSKYLDPVPSELKDDRRKNLADRRADEEHPTEVEARSGQERRQDTTAGALNIIVVETGQLRYGLVVDGLHDSEEIVVKPLGRHMKGVRCLAGATILGDGHVALILDIAGIAAQCAIEMPEEHGATARAEESAAQKAEHQTALLFTNDPSEQFGVSMSLISRIERIRAEQIDSVGGQEVLQYRGSSLPLLSLDKLIKAKPRPEQPHMYVIVFHLIGQRQEIGLIAPNLVDIREISTDIDVVTFREPGVLGSLVIDEKTTRLIDLSELARAAHGEWFSQQQQAAATDAGRRILFAEDSAFFRKQVAGFLSEAGYEVQACEDGLVAWNAIQQSAEPFDLVVTDIEMPNMDGYELTRKIKNDQRFANIPVIAVTSLAGQENIQKGGEVGIDEYQIKLDRDQLIAAVTRLIKRSATAVSGRNA